MASEPEVIARLRSKFSTKRQTTFGFSGVQIRAALAAWNELQTENATLRERLEAKCDEENRDLQTLHEVVSAPNDASFPEMFATLRERLEAAEQRVKLLQQLNRQEKSSND